MTMSMIAPKEPADKIKIRITSTDGLIETCFQDMPNDKEDLADQLARQLEIMRRFKK